MPVGHGEQACVETFHSSLAGHVSLLHTLPVHNRYVLLVPWQPIIFDVVTPAHRFLFHLPVQVHAKTPSSSSEDSEEESEPAIAFKAATATITTTRRNFIFVL
jgi:hypothetical protein